MKIVEEKNVILDKIVEELSKKYNKKKYVISKMIKECFRIGYDIKTTKIFIEEFFK